MCPSKTALDVSQNRNLASLECYSNRLTVLDTRANEHLRTLDCSSNRLASLDVSANTALEGFSCSGNRLTFLSLQGLSALTHVQVGGQTRDGIVLLNKGGRYVLNLGTLIPAEGRGKVSGLAGQAGGVTTTPAPIYDPASGKATFSSQPEKVTYQYNTGNPSYPMDVTLTIAGVTTEHTITVTASGNGKVMGGNVIVSSPVSVLHGSSVTFAASADAGYEIESLKVDGNPVNAASGMERYPYTFSNVSEDHTLEARFKAKAAPPIPPVRHTITVTASDHGKVMSGDVSLSGPVSVLHGSSVTFAVSADAGYDIDYLRVSGALVGAASGTERYEHTIPSVTTDLRLEAAFKAKAAPPTVQHRITVTAPGGHGRVTLQGAAESLSGDVSVSHGSSVTFAASADAGYEIESLKVDGSPVNAASGTERYPYTFSNVSEDHTLEARFKAKPTPPVNPPTPPVNPPVQPSDPNVPPERPPASPDMTPPASSDVPAPAPSGPADIPSSAGQWTVSWGTRDAQGNVGVTVLVSINSEAPLIASSIRVEASGIEGTKAELLSGDLTVSVHAAAQAYRYRLRITGTVAESARNTARIDRVYYKVEGSDKEHAAPLGKTGGGILLKDMTKGSEAQEPDSGGGCSAGLGSAALLALVPFCVRRRR